MVMFLVSVAQSKDSDHKSKANHSVFKYLIMNDIDAKQREARKEQRQQRTVNCTGNRRGYTQCIPIDFTIKHRTKITAATLLQNICFCWGSNYVCYYLVGFTTKYTKVYTRRHKDYRGGVVKPCVPCVSSLGVLCGRKQSVYSFQNT